MSRELPTNPKTEQELFDLMMSDEIKLSFTNFVTHFFRWKEVGTPLEHCEAPRPWQLYVMNDVDIHCLANVDNPNPKIFKGAISAGRGIGKTTLNAWMMLWLISTRPGISVICLANSETQLKSTLWAEVSKWLAMMPNRHWFEMQSLSLHPAPWYADLLRTNLSIDSRHYYIMGRTYSEENPGAIVGNHNSIGLAYFVDESSDTPESITSRLHGSLTEINANRFWIMTSNPRRLTGLFYDIFNKPLEEWKRYQIDTRTVEGIDPSFYEDIIARHGIDSDIVKVEVLGQFPNQEENSFFSNELIEEAINRKAYPDPYAPLIMGCDIAGEGEDKTVVVLRRGNIIEKMISWSGLNIKITNEKIARLIEQYVPDAIAIDAMGIGAVTFNYLDQYIIEPVIGHEKASEPAIYRNRRVELLDFVRQAMRISLQLPDHPELKNEMKSTISFAEINTGRLAIENKRKGGSKFGVRSTDFLDALSYTYAVTPARKDAPYSFRSSSKYESEELLIERRYA